MEIQCLSVCLSVCLHAMNASHAIKVSVLPDLTWPGLLYLAFKLFEHNGALAKRYP
eukprot:COSAG06_NODE_240_length_19339_cov_16.770582_7_plen_56_part_00